MPVTRVDAAPDLRNATVWIGLLGTPAVQDKIWARIEGGQGQLQDALNTIWGVKPKPGASFREFLHARA